MSVIIEVINQLMTCSISVVAELLV